MSVFSQSVKNFPVLIGPVPLFAVQSMLGARNVVELPYSEFHKRLEQHQIKEVVVYGFKGNPYVYFGLVTLRYFSAANARVYHGGIDDWKAAGNPVSTEPARLAPPVSTARRSATGFEARSRVGLIASTN